MIEANAKQWRRRAHRRPEDRVFCEDGATNSFGEYRWWLHVWREGDEETAISNIYPWPLATSTIDAEFLAATMSITKMKNWPGGWPVFGLGFSSMPRDGVIYFWKLAPGMGKQMLFNDKYPAYQIPEVFLNAIT